MNTTIFKVADPKQYDCVLGVGFKGEKDKDFYLKVWRLQKKENVRTLMDVVIGIANGTVVDNIKRN